MDFNNKIAVVTGAGRGIGAAVAHLLAQLGATVALIDCDSETVHHTAKAINSLGHRALAYPGDVSDALQIKGLLDLVESELGPIEYLAHAAGVLSNSLLLDTPIEEWERLLKVNTTGTFIMTKEVGRRLALRGTGSMVVVTSNASNTPRLGLGAYAASKAAAAMITRCIGLELSSKGIRCNIVSPGSTETQMLHDSLPQGSDYHFLIKGDLQRYRLGIPMGRIGTPNDIANAVAFLLSDLSSHITLADLCVDGGATLGQ